MITALALFVLFSIESIHLPPYCKFIRPQSPVGNRPVEFLTEDEMKKY